MYAPLSAGLLPSLAAPVYVAFVIFLRQIALVMRFSGQFVPFAVHFESFCSTFCVFLRCVRLFAVHFTVFSVLLMIFFCAPHSFGGAGTGTTRRRNIFYIFFADLLTNKRVN